MSDVSKEKLRKALDDFEEEDFVSSKDTIRNEIKKKVNDYLKDKTEIKSDPVDVPEEEKEEKEEKEE